MIEKGELARIIADKISSSHSITEAAYLSADSIIELIEKCRLDAVQATPDTPVV